MCIIIPQLINVGSHGHRKHKEPFRDAPGRELSVSSICLKKKESFTAMGTWAIQEVHLYQLCMSMQGNDTAAGNLRVCFGKAVHTEWPMFAADVD